MTYLFSRPARDLLETFAWSNVLLAFDFDGTLAPIVSRPERAVMRRMTRRLLTRVRDLYPCVVLSGRARADVQRRLRGLKLHVIVGNHGAEPSQNAADMRRRVRSWLPVLRARLDGRQGVVIEDKTYSITVHYRHAQRRSATQHAVLAAAASLDGVRLVGGKLAINFTVPGAPDKGTALDLQRSQFACDTVIYFGDDETDEDVFRLDRPGRLLSVRVGRKRQSAARYYIRNQREMDRVLQTLIAVRVDADA